jgi:threonine/homoserine/homoserine lactone efflux protein
MDSPLLFLATTLAILAAPGPTNALFAMSGALRGVRRSLVLIPAGAAGYLIAVTLLGLALGPALAAAHAATRILRLLVGAYLFVLAFRLWRKGSAADGRTAAVGAREVFVITLLNPKALVFAMAVIPFGRPDVGLYLAAFVASVSLTGVGWLIIGESAGRAALSGGQARLIPRVGSVVLAVFGGLLAYPAL